MEAPFPKTTASAQELVVQLMDRGYSAQTISDLMAQRVSWRTIYRWARGESKPHQPSDLSELRRVAEGLMETSPPESTEPSA